MSAMKEQAQVPQRAPPSRRALIQTFEYTFELSHKTLSAAIFRKPSQVPRPSQSTPLKVSSGAPRKIGSSPHQIAVSKDFRQARHRYTESHLQRGQGRPRQLARIRAFAEEVSYLLTRLQERIESHA